MVETDVHVIQYYNCYNSLTIKIVIYIIIMNQFKLVYIHYIIIIRLVQVIDYEQLYAITIN